MCGTEYASEIVMAKLFISVGKLSRLFGYNVDWPGHRDILIRLDLLQEISGETP